MESLKLCPFCGGEAQLEYCGVSRCFRMHTAKVECSVCGAIGDSGASYKSGEDAECDAINKWNTRASGWISVDDALPENDAQYIAWVGERAIVLFYCDDGYWCEHYGVRDYSKYVTHWMPLPQPPEVEHG